jgi:hypothetical protein
MILGIEEADLSPITGLLFSNSAGYPQYYHGAAGGGQASSAPAGLVLPGQLVLLVGTGDGSNTYLYVNAVQMTGAATPLTAASTAESRFWVGKRGNGTTLARPGFEIYKGGIVPFVLSPLQIRDLAYSLGVNV